MKRLRWGVPLVLVLLLVRERQALACTFVAWSGLTYADGIYAPPGTTWRAEREQARARVAAFYGPLRGRPTLVFSDEARLARFMDGTTGVTRYQPWGATTVVGPAGQNVDVLAHELAHAELFARIGYWKLDWCVPTWFDEGLAVQFDQRPFYNEEALQQRVREGWRVPSVTELSTRAAFFEGDRDHVRFHYAVARAAVGAWLHEDRGALSKIETLSCAGWREFVPTR